MLIAFGAAPDGGQEEGGEKEGGGAEDDFGRTRKIYKSAIIALIVLLLLTIWIRHGRTKGFWPGKRGVFKVMHLLVFFALLIFF
jgi:hypothetical protein